MTSSATDEYAESQGQRYETLCDRAVTFVTEHGGASPEDLLIEYVFGNSGPRSMWRPLLRTVLGEDDRLVFRADGMWGLIGEAQSGDGIALLGDFVAVDVETTGLRPLTQRIIEVALYRYHDGERVERLESLVNPGTSIPAFITNLTTITNEQVDDAPVFGDLAAKVYEFIGDSLMVGHNVAFDLGFLNAELKRAELPVLVNDRIDTMALAVKLLRDVRKPSLDRVAVAVGLTPRKFHRAGRDAQLTAEVALRLADEAIRQGVTSMDQLKSAATLRQHRPRDNVGRGRAVMDKEWLKDIPRKPGVYMMIDRHDAVIYVGKAKNLRDRVASYYHQPLGYTRKMDGLLESMARIETEVVGSELQALILESQMIQRHQPRYNTAMRSFEHYPYIKVDLSNPWPRVQLSRVRKDDGARYFGPYRSASGARKTVDVIESAVPLRTCTRTFKSAKSYGNPCIRLDIGQCLGPCVNQAIRDEYQGLARDVVSFLEGDEDGLRQRILKELQDAADRLDFERADKLRKNMRSAMALIEEQARFRTAAIDHNLILVQPSPRPEMRIMFLVLDGRVWAHFDISRKDELRNTVPGRSDDDMVIGVRHGSGSDAGPPVNRDGLSDVGVESRILASLDRFRASRACPIDHYAIDEQNILTRWLYQHADHPSLIPIRPDKVTGAEDVATWVEAARAVDEDAIQALDAVQRKIPASDIDRAASLVAGESNAAEATSSTSMA